MRDHHHNHLYQILCSFVLLCQIKLKKRIWLSSSPSSSLLLQQNAEQDIVPPANYAKEERLKLFSVSTTTYQGTTLSQKECFQLIFENESHIKRGRNTEYDEWQFNWVWVLSILVVCLCTPWFREEWLLNRIWPQDNHCWTTSSRSTKAGQLLSSVQIIQFQLLINLNGRG